MATFLSGKIGKVTVGATDINVTGWQATPETTVLDATNSGSAGYVTSVDGVHKCNGQFECDYDTDVPPFASPPNLNVGQVVALKLYVGDPASNKYVSIPTARISQTPIVSEVLGKVKLTCQFESMAAFTLPT